MIFELIQRRRSVFPAQYNEQPIKKSDIEKILEAANWAPTHKKTEPWRFKVLLGEKKNELGVFLSIKRKLRFLRKGKSGAQYDQENKCYSHAYA